MTNTALYCLLKSKLANGGGVQVQSDWAQTNSAAIDYIKNKPVEATDDEIMELLMGYNIITLVSDTTGYIYLDADDKILVI